MIRLREYPEISGSCSSSGTLHASRSFGETFSSEAKQRMQKERRDALLENSHRRRRGQELEALMLLRVAESRPLRGLGVYVAIPTSLLLVALLVCAAIQPTDARQGALISAIAVILCHGINMGNARLWQIAGGGAAIHWVFVWSHACHRPRLRAYILVCWSSTALGLVVMTVHHSIIGFWQDMMIIWPGVCCCIIGMYMCYDGSVRNLAGPDIPYQTKGNPVEGQEETGERMERTILFEGRVLPDRVCICSWPGKYETAFEKLVSSSAERSVATVFLPKCAAAYGKHSKIPASEQLHGDCWCTPLYGGRKTWVVISRAICMVTSTYNPI